MEFIEWLRRNFPIAAAAAQTAGPGDTITWDKEAVERQLTNGRVERIAWTSLREVRIVTTTARRGQGTFYWILVGEGDAVCIVPEDSVGLPFLQRLQELRGFDNEVFIEACRSTNHDQFVCWRRDDARE